MQEIIQEFIDFMSEHGLAPAAQSDIKANNKRINYKLLTATNHKKHGYYKLEILGDFGYGFVGDYRDDSCFSWHSKSSKKYSKSEIEEFRKKAQIEREKEEEKRKEVHRQKAIYAQDFTVFLDECPNDHPYLLKKNVKSHGLLISGNDIILPMSDQEQMWSFQTITPEGDKKYLPKAKKTGTWFEIRGDETICIVEGYATGASVYEATGHSVIVTFDSGNLKYSAKKIKELNPNSDIIICADNDFESVDTQGKLRNTGLLAGEAAAKEIGARIAYPLFTKENSGNSDFNDYAALHGLGAVKQRIHDAKRDGQSSGGIKEEVSPIGVQAPAIRTRSTPSEEWRNELRVNAKGELNLRSALNAALIVENSTELLGLFRYDSFSKTIMVCYCPPWEEEADFKVRRLEDKDYFGLACFLEYQWGLTVGKTVICDALESTARSKENIFNPATEYFNSLEWDGVPRLNEWLYKYVSDNSQSRDYLSMVGRKFLCGMAARAMFPAIKFDTMIILEGDQYAGKSRLARLLATINGEEYFLDDFKDIESKDTLMKMQGKLIVEFPEITTMRKTEVDDLKAFVVRQSDVFRAPYGRQVIEAPRQCVFIGTVNPEGGYLRDVTGNRRYWPIACRERLSLDAMIPIIPQLHAEAAHLVKNGEQLWLKESEYQLAVEEQNKRVVDDVWADRIEEITNNRMIITSDEILDGLNITIDKRNPMIYKRVKDSMLKNGYKYGLVQIGQKRKRGYSKTNTGGLI